MIGDYVWHDQDRDGIQDAGEPGLQGVTVTLRDSGGNVVATTITGANGFYQFTGLCADTYTVDVDESTLPANVNTPTTPNVGGDDTIDSDGPLNGGSVSVTLPIDDAQDLTIDFGYITPCTGVIGDFVWHDLNRNGIQDPGEPGIGGARVELRDPATNVLIAQTTTGANGFYQFTGLCAGQYKVDVVEGTLPPELRTPTDPNQGLDDAKDSDGPVNGDPVMVTLPNDDTEDRTIDFGYIAPCTGVIGDFVWHDLDRDGIQDFNEPGLQGVRVILRDGAGNEIATTTTGLDGFYEFTGLCAGDYTVDVDETTLPPDLQVPTLPNQGGDDTMDSDGPANGGQVNVTLPADNTEDRTIDFGYVSECTGVIGDFVWHDLNRNGIQDPGEPGIAGARVELRDPATNVLIAETTTDGVGFYEFTGLCAGDYKVDVVEGTLPASVNTPTTPDVGGDDTVDSDGPLSGDPVMVTLPNDFTEDLTIDFGYISECTGEIGDFVWNDLNRNGIQDAGEPGIAGVEVILRDATGATLATDTTDANGFYQFTGLCAGDYTVDVDETTLPAGLDPTLPNQGGDDTVDSDGPVNGDPVPVTLPNDNAKDDTIDFGYIAECTGEIGDFVWNDLNRNGIQDAGELGIAGVVVTLRDATGATLATDTTDANGFYQFTGLCAGDYTVDVDETTLPAGLDPTLPNQGGDDTVDSDGPVNGDPVPVTLPNDNAKDDTIDFGYIAPCTGEIGDFVWNDLNRNGIQDAGEPGIAGVVVILRDATGATLAMDTTDANGFYQFTGLCAGDYTVDVDENTVPAGLNPTLPNQGGDTVDSDGPLNGDPVPVTLPNDNAKDDTIDFGYIAPCTGLIGDFVWNDLNRNGIQDAGEPGIPGVEVILRDATGATLATDITDGSGFYQFTGLCAGAYTVDVNPATVPAGMTPTLPNQGGDDTVDSDGAPVSVTLPTDNSEDRSIDFGYFQPAPAIDIRKQAEGPDSRTVVSGSDVDFEIVVTNTGQVPLVNVQVTDALVPSCANDIGNLAVNQVVTYSCTATNVTTDFTNIAKVNGESESGEPVMDEDPSSVTVLRPAIDIRKQAEGPDSRTVVSGSDVDFEIVVTNTGQVPLVNVQVTDALVPSCANDIGNLAVNQVVTYSCTATNVTTDFTNIAKVNGESESGEPVMDEDPSSVTVPLDCGLDVFKTCAVIQQPSSSFDCSDAKPINSLSMIWSGGQAVRIKAWKGNVGSTQLADMDNIQPGDEVTVTGFAGSPNDVFWEIFAAGTNTKLGESAFHLSCSDDEMDGPEDCGKAEGNGKSNSSGLLNTWTFEGMAGNGEALDCTVSPQPPAEACIVTPAPLPNCDTAGGKPDSLTFRYTGGGCSASDNDQDSGKATCSGAINPGQSITVVSGNGYTVTPATVAPNGEFTISDSGFDSNSELSLSNGGGTEFLEIHTSCSQPLEVGDVFGSLTLVAFNGQTGGANVEYGYTLVNNGSPVSNVLLVDDKLGQIAGPLTLGAGETRDFTQGSLIMQTTTNVATATGQLANGQLCEVQDAVTVTVEEPCAECKGGLVELSLEYLGASAANVVIYDDKDPKADKILFQGQLQPGQTVTITPRSGQDKLNNDISLWAGGVLNTLIHTSCSKPIGPGLILEDFKVVEAESKDNGRVCPLFEDCGANPESELDIGGDTVKWKIFNTGVSPLIVQSIEIEWPVANGGLEKVKLDGDIFKPQTPLAPGFALIDGGWTEDLKNRTIKAGDNKTMEFEFVDDASEVEGNYSIRVVFQGEQCSIEFTPSSPGGSTFACDKPIDALTMAWDGTQTIRVKAWKGSVGSTLLADVDGISVGSEIAVNGYAGSPNDVIWEVFAAGGSTKLGESTFHLSCSDDNMDGPEDCGKRQGDGKNKSGFLNDWLLRGMVDSKSVLVCP